MSHEAHQRAAAGIKIGVAILTLSDTRTAATDTSGQAICHLLEAAGHHVVEASLIPDDPVRLRETLTRWLSEPSIDAIITNGGTGVSRRDQTIPTVEAMIQTPLPGFGELFRMLSHAEIGSAALLSRATAGITANGKFLAALPGSTAAVELAMTKLLLPQLGHIVGELRK